MPNQFTPSGLQPGERPGRRFVELLGTLGFGVEAIGHLSRARKRFLAGCETACFGQLSLQQFHAPVSISSVALLAERSTNIGLNLRYGVGVLDRLRQMVEQLSYTESAR
jgi:hypothetical protein